MAAARRASGRRAPAPLKARRPGWPSGGPRSSGAGVGGPDDDFFDHGGGSLSAAQLVSPLRERYPEVTVADVYDHPRLGRPGRRPRRARAAVGAVRADRAALPVRGAQAVQSARGSSRWPP